MIFLRIEKKKITKDQFGNPIEETESEETYEINSKLHPVNTNNLTLTSYGVEIKKYKKFYVYNNEIPIKVNDIIYLNNEKYKIFDISEYSEHKEVVVSGLE